MVPDHDLASSTADRTVPMRFVMAGDKAHSGTDKILLVSLYVLEVALLLFVLAVNKKGPDPLPSFLPSIPGKILVLSSLIMVLACALALGRLATSGKEALPRIARAASLNLVTILIPVLAVEVALRGWSKETLAGEQFRTTLLLPKNWQKMRTRLRDIWNQASADLSYLEFNSALGWTVGASKHSDNGLYFSSVEGLRAETAKTELARVPHRYRVALVGDSYTFGEEVSYHDTWGYHLEQELGDNYQVLNFGVPGYGVDQSYLRYASDVVSWNPDVVVLSFVQHDLLRTLTVYNFLDFPDWNFPFSKPRFILADEQLRLFNQPTISPDRIIAVPAIVELPFVELDPGYDPWEWEEIFGSGSYLVRWLVSKFPRWPSARPEVSLQARNRVNSAILRRFLEISSGTGPIPLLVYLPNRTDLLSGTPGRGAAERMLHEADLPYLSPYSCLHEIEEDQRFLVYHYTPRANEAVARCLKPFIQRAVETGRANQRVDELGGEPSNPQPSARPRG